MCNHTGCGGYEQISTVYLRVFAKASTKTWRGVPVKEDCSVCAAPVRPKRPDVLLPAPQSAASRSPLL